MTLRLLVGLGQAQEITEARRYLRHWLGVAVGVGVGVQVVVFDEGPAADLMGEVAEVREFTPLAPRSPSGLVQSMARRVDRRLESAIFDVRTAKDCRWIDEPDAIHLHGPLAASLLPYVRTSNAPVVTYVHPHDFSIAGLSPRDRAILVDRTDRFLVAPDPWAELDPAVGLVPDLSAMAALMEAGVDRDRIELAPVTVPAPPHFPTTDERTATRLGFGMPGDRPIIVVPPTLDWAEAPDLTVSLAWELVRRRGEAAPHVLWYGMPDDGEARWALEADLDRIGLSNVHLRSDVPKMADLLELADVIVIPARPQTSAAAPTLDEAADGLIPVLCWSGSDFEPAVATWPGSVIPCPDVGAMAESVLDLAEQTEARARVRRVAWQPMVAELERLAPLEVPAP